MKRTFKFFAAALAIVAAASCAKENAPIENNAEDNASTELVQLSFPATINNPSDPSTRTTLSGLDVHWVTGDEIFIHNSSNTSEYAVLSAGSVEEDYAVFSGNGPAADSYTAIYPAYLCMDDPYALGSFAANTLSEQRVRNNDFSTIEWNGTHVPSNIAVANAAANERLTFNNILSYFKFSIASEGVRSIEISAERTQHYQYTDQATPNYNIGGTLVHSGGSVIGTNTYKSITVTYRNVSNLDADFNPAETYYVAIPPVKMEGLTFTFKDKDGNVLHTLRKSYFAPEANNIYNLGAIEMPAANAAQVGDYFYTDGTYSTEYDSTKSLAGIVFYVGDGMMADETLMASEYKGCTHGLVVSTSYVSKSAYYTKNTSLWDKTGYMTTVGRVGSTDQASMLNMTGYNNTKVLEVPGTTYHNSIKYLTNDYNNVKQVTGATPWFIPCGAELLKLADNLSVVVKSITAAGLTDNLSYKTFHSSSCRIASEYATSVTVLTVNVANKGIGTVNTNANSYMYVPIFAF